MKKRDSDRLCSAISGWFLVVLHLLAKVSLINFFSLKFMGGWLKVRLCFERLYNFMFFFRENVWVPEQKLMMLFNLVYKS